MAAETKDLDETLPAELRTLVRYGGPLSDADRAKAIASEDNKTPSPAAPTETPMAVATEPTAVMTEDQIKAHVQQAVAAITADRDREQALASRITTLVTDANTARAEASDLQKQLENVKAKAASTEELLKAAQADATKAKVDLTSMSDEKKTVETRYQEAKAALDTMTKQLADARAEKVVAARMDKLEKSKMKTDDRAKKACARDEKGGFKMSDEDFDGYVAELTEVYAAGEAAAKKVPGKGKNDEQEDNAKAKASTDETVPAAPVLDSAEAMAQATAAMLSGTPLPKDRVSVWSDMFH